MQQVQGSSADKERCSPKVVAPPKPEGAVPEAPPNAGAVPEAPPNAGAMPELPPNAGAAPEPPPNPPEAALWEAPKPPDATARGPAKLDAVPGWVAGWAKGCPVGVPKGAKEAGASAGAAAPPPPSPLICHPHLARGQIHASRPATISGHHIPHHRTHHIATGTSSAAGYPL